MHHMQQVTHANDSDNPQKKFDAREKGSNEYEDHRTKKRKKKEDNDNSGKVNAKASARGFDMKI